MFMKDSTHTGFYSGRLTMHVAWGSPGDPPDPGIKPVSAALAGRCYTTLPPGKPERCLGGCKKYSAAAWRFPGPSPPAPPFFLLLLHPQVWTQCQALCWELWTAQCLGQTCLSVFINPLSQGYARWVARRRQPGTLHSLSGRGEPKASGAGKTSWRKAQGAEQETPGFFPLFFFFLPSPILPSCLPVFWRLSWIFVPTEVMVSITIYYC